MGCHPSVTATTFPPQAHVGDRVEVTFHYDTEWAFCGTILRNDLTAPWHTIIQLDDGRIVLDVECQYVPL